MSWSSHSPSPWEDDGGAKVKGALLGLAGLVILGGLFGGYWWLSQKRGQIDEATNCPVSGPLAIHALLFDRSDPITPLQGQRVRQEIGGLRDAKRGERIDLYVVEGDGTTMLTPVFSMCSPGQGKDANELYENPQAIQKKFEESFAGELDRTLASLLKASNRPNSPILESIKAAAVTSFGTLEPGSTPLRMTIISDMAQHTAAYSQFRDDGSFEALSRRAEWRTLRPDLKGADVQIYYLLRNSAKRRNGQLIQNRGHQTFWEQAISGSNGRLARIISL